MHLSIYTDSCIGIHLYARDRIIVERCDGFQLQWTGL